ncbi:MAG TPA: hypothetical protein VFF39_16425 [Verrucomicrobiae bacterium]|jgi:hypothetical protein|nr:hypothetical protein [Verrucomicrobiae bacterium]
MKSSLFSKIIFAALALALTASAFAANDSHKSNFEISAPTQVNGTQLAAGEYTAKWEGSGPTVQVSILQGKKVIATVPAQVVALTEPAAQTQAEVKSNSSGDRELTSLQFSGKKYSLDLGSESAKAQSKTESTN